MKKFISRLLNSETPDDLSKDPRWRRFNDSDFKCPCCGKSYGGVFDIGFDHPDPWPHGHRGNSGLELLKVGEDELGTDLCIFDGNYFVRSILILPIVGAETDFSFGCWGSLSKESFDTYIDDGKGETVFEGAFSWLCNSLPCFESSEPLACNMHPGEEGMRPTLWVKEGHLLHDAQRDGISFDTLLDIYERTGNDIRSHISDA